MCGQCSAGYYPLLDSCHECPDVPLLPLLIGVAALAALSLLSLAGILTAGRMQVLRELAGYVQVLSISIAINLEWLPPTFVGVVMTWLQGVWDGVGLYSLHCMMDVSYYSSLAMLVLGMVAAAVAMVVMIVVSRKLAAKSHKRALDRLSRDGGKADDSNRHSKRTQVLEQLLVTMLLLFLMPLTRKLMQAQACMETGFGSRLKADITIACDSPSHIAWRVVLGIITVALVVVLPAAMAVLLRRLRRTGSLHHYPALAALYEPYVAAYPYMESIRVVWQALLIVGTLWWSNNPWWQCGWSIVITGGYTIVVAGLQPWIRTPRSVLCFKVRNAFNRFVLAGCASQLLVLVFGSAARLSEQSWGIVAQGSHVLGSVSAVCAGACSVAMIVIAVQFVVQQKHRAGGQGGMPGAIRAAYGAGDSAAAVELARQWRTVCQRKLASLQAELAAARAQTLSDPEFVPSETVLDRMDTLDQQVGNLNASLSPAEGTQARCDEVLAAYRASRAQARWQPRKELCSSVSWQPAVCRGIVAAANNSDMSHAAASAALRSLEAALVEKLKIKAALQVAAALQGHTAAEVTATRKQVREAKAAGAEMRRFFKRLRGAAACRGSEVHRSLLPLRSAYDAATVVSRACQAPHRYMAVAVAQEWLTWWSERDRCDGRGHDNEESKQWGDASAASADHITVQMEGGDGVLTAAKAVMQRCSSRTSSARAAVPQLREVSWAAVKLHDTMEAARGAALDALYKLEAEAVRGRRVHAAMSISRLVEGVPEVLPTAEEQGATALAVTRVKAWLSSGEGGADNEPSVVFHKLAQQHNITGAVAVAREVAGFMQEVVGSELPAESRVAAFVHERKRLQTAEFGSVEWNESAWNRVIIRTLAASHDSAQLNAALQECLAWLQAQWASLSAVRAALQQRWHIALEAQAAMQKVEQLRSAVSRRWVVRLVAEVGAYSDLHRAVASLLCAGGGTGGEALPSRLVALGAAAVAQLSVGTDSQGLEPLKHSCGAVKEQYAAKRDEMKRKLVSADAAVRDEGRQARAALVEWLKAQTREVGTKCGRAEEVGVFTEAVEYAKLHRWLCKTRARWQQ